MEPFLRHGTIALFRKRKQPTRSDIVLVDHPELGRVVRKVKAVGRNGNLHLTATSRRFGQEKQKAGKVPMSAVRGILVSRLGRISLFGPRRSV